MSGAADMGQDLRSYLDRIKRDKPDELVIVSKEVDPAYEITALVVKLERERAPPPRHHLRARARHAVPRHHQPAREPLAAGHRDARGAAGDARRLPARDGASRSRRAWWRPAR